MATDIFATLKTVVRHVQIKVSKLTPDQALKISALGVPLHRLNAIQKGGDPTYDELSTLAYLFSPAPGTPGRVRQTGAERN